MQVESFAKHPKVICQHEVVGENEQSLAPSLQNEKVNFWLPLSNTSFTDYTEFSISQNSTFFQNFQVDSKIAVEL